MDILYAPWRSQYSGDTGRKKDENVPEHECLFCHIYKQHNNEKDFVLKRYDHTFVMLNRYPYNAGHLLVLPVKHVSKLSQLNTEERAAFMEVTNSAIEIVTNILKPDGLNVGINLGKSAGAGMPSHLHLHILPRWQGDTNFVPAIGKTKVISFDLNDIYEKLKIGFDSLPAK